MCIFIGLSFEIKKQFHRLRARVASHLRRVDPNQMHQPLSKAKVWKFSSTLRNVKTQNWKHALIRRILPNWYAGFIQALLIRCQFHQHFMSSFFCTKVFFAGFLLLTIRKRKSKMKLAKKLLVKCWWTWLKVVRCFVFLTIKTNNLLTGGLG